MNETTSQPSHTLISEELRDAHPSALWNEVVAHGAALSAMPASAERGARTLLGLDRFNASPLIDRATGQWRKGTFLVDDKGMIKPEWKDALASASQEVLANSEYQHAPLGQVRTLIISKMLASNNFLEAYQHAATQAAAAAARG